ncbi:TonB-dependent receptor [Puia dinghuensis]|uniref:Collagen-binding protein n=1 Tax=Puia dinghuensis TaxID=1792502 RepID=A0A8J2XSX4_9BACT|nr:TonB-dependent receptor [Puia dinghuensis]GGA99447.1 collagen-binding protein [Puia dinghuensis]
MTNYLYKQSLFLLTLSLLVLTGTAQVHFTVDGTIRDKKTGEVLIGATVSLLEIPRSGIMSNAYGFYSISASPGHYTLLVSFSGYQPDTVIINLDKNLLLPIELTTASNQLAEIVVSAQKRNDNTISSPLMGVQKLTTTDIKNVPVLFGEKDVLKTIQLLPGIQFASDGNSGFYVRGGGADQNLILLDEATVYNPSHLLGFFSTFNSDAIKDITVYKGGMPAEYGGRLSSVIDIKMNDGNNKDYQFGGGIGLISTRLNAEGPIVKDRGSFTISGRRTYADLFLKLSSDSSVSNNSLYFYDLNIKANYRFDEKNRVYLSGYFGRDNLSFGNTFGIDYGNATGTARWNHVFNSRLFSNTSVIFSKYSYKIKINSDNNNIGLTSNIRDIDLKEDLQYYIDADNKINFGLGTIHHTIAPGILSASQSSSFNNLVLQNKYSLENALYISHEWSPADRLHFNYGLRVAEFIVLGPPDSIVTTYTNLEPRASLSLRVNQVSSVKLSYNRNTQVLHLLSNSTSANPTDLWIPSSNNVKPEIADQGSIGYYRNIRDNHYEFSIEAYYKAMQNQIDYKNGAQLIANENVESQLLFGKGRAYGLELFGKKKTGRLTGWVSYTLSRTELQIDGINQNKWYPNKQDRTHDISIVGIYQANRKWTLSATWVYYTGNAVTFPSGKYTVDGQTAFYYTERNGYRMPAYHRMDVAATLQGKKKKRYESSWTFSIYNLYGRENAYSIVFQTDPNDPTRTQALQYALFRFVPAVTYNFKF